MFVMCEDWNSVTLFLWWSTFFSSLCLGRSSVLGFVKALKQAHRFLFHYSSVQAFIRTS
jgi:hypothetical protein